MKRILAVVLSLALAYSAIPADAATAKAGASCPKISSISKIANKTFKCVLSGKKKIWRLVSSSPTKPIKQVDAAKKFKSVLSPLADFQDNATCRLVDADPQMKHFTAGFPIPAERAKLTTKLVVQVVAVDFPDVQGGNPSKDLADVASYVTNFFESTGPKAVSIEWRIPSSYVRLPKNVLDYQLNANFFDDSTNIERVVGRYFDYARAAIILADPEIDFSEVGVIAVVGPKQIRNSQIGMFVAQAEAPGRGFMTQEGKINNVLIRGNDERRDLINWTHEFGHMLGLTDTRNTESRQNQKSGGLGIFDLMSNYQAIELLAWHRFLLGVLNDNQIHCVKSGTTTTTLLDPVGASSLGVKGIVIPLSEHTGIAIESRRAVRYDARSLTPRMEGVLVHVIDTSIPYRKSPFAIVPAPGSVDRENETDALLKPGQSVTVAGWTISVLEGNSMGDVVKLAPSK